MKPFTHETAPADTAVKEYKASKGTTVATWIFAPLMIALFVAFPFLMYDPAKRNGVATLAFSIPVSLIMIAVMLVALIDTIKGRFIISKDGITSRTAFGNRTLLFTEIKGYRVTDKFVMIESAVPRKKNIRISKYLGGYKEITQWLADNFDDVDVVTKKKEEEEILSNEAFGFTGEERSARLEGARKVCRVLNIAGSLIGIWLFIYPRPYLYALAAGLAMPWIALVVTKLYKGLVHVGESKGSAYPSLMVAILMPSVGVAIRALTDYNLYSYEHVWLPALLIAGAFISILTVGNRELLWSSRKGLVIAVFLSVFAFGYAYGAVVTTNCYFDTSVAESYSVSVLGKRISTGKHTSYYLTLSAWRDEKEADEIDVGRRLYDEVAVNDVVQVYYMKGAFDIPWFEISK